MRQIVVISGKGGTGKTSITAALASVASKTVLADCDVDAPDLYLLLKPEIFKKGVYRAGKLAEIDQSKCTRCGRCLQECRFGAIGPDYVVDEISCESCGLCRHVCPSHAIILKERICGEWFISKTRLGLMSHAKLDVGAENSGKLVTLVRKNALELAREKGAGLILIDGPPGTACPVMASLTGVDHALIVCEPTLSGIHDLTRVIKLCDHFKVSYTVCINKYDINLENTIEIEKLAPGIRIPYSTAFTRSMIEGKTIVEYQDKNIETLIQKLANCINLSVGL